MTELKTKTLWQNTENQIKDPKGILRDNSGRLWEITDSQAKSLLKDTKPVEYVDHGGENTPVWDIDKNGERYIQQAKHVNACVFNAIKEYLNSMGMGTLTEGDKDFFVSHPDVNSDGVGRAKVLGVAQGLLVPWGLGIERVWMPSGTNLGGQHREFMVALGANPVALTDWKTSNSELAETLELNKEQARELAESYRFEFVDTPGRPCVVMLENYKAKTTKGGVTTKTYANVGGQWSNTMYGMGHADFVGPRDKMYGDWVLAFSISRNPKYNNESMDSYADVEGSSTSSLSLSTWQSLIDGRSINSRTTTTTKTYGPFHSRANQRYLPASTQTQKEDISQKCPQCESDAIESLNGLVYCLDCGWWEDSTGKYTYDVPCPFCGENLIFNEFCDCGYSEGDWVISALRKCKNHECEVYYTQDEITHELHYICPSCLKQDDKTVADMIASESNHNSRTYTIESE